MAGNPFRSVIERHLGFLGDPSPRPPPLAHFVNSLPGPDLAERIQDGDFITNSGLFRPSNRLRAGYRWCAYNSELR